MLVWILLNTAAWFIVGVEVHNLWRRMQAGAPRPTTTPASQEAHSAVALGATSRGSPASISLQQTLDSLQALGNQAQTALSDAEHCSKCREWQEWHGLLYKTLAQAVVDLASTSASEAMSSFVGPEPGPATFGSSVSSERIKTWPLSPLTPSDAVQGVPMNDY